MTDIAITGIGLLTALGTTTAQTLAAVEANTKLQLSTLPELADTPLKNALAATPPKLNPKERLSNPRMLKFMSHSAVFGCIAAQEAVAQSNLKTRFNPERVGLFAATGLAAADAPQVQPMLEASIDKNGLFSPQLLGERGLAATNPLRSFQVLANMPACLVSIIEGIKGPNYIFSPWESQSALALEEAICALQSKEIDCAVVGGGDSPAHAATFVYLRSFGWLDKTQIPANAGAYLVLEKSSTAKKDNQQIFGTIEAVNITKENKLENKLTDGLNAILGRTYVAAPFIAAGLACLTDKIQPTVKSADGIDIELKIRRQK